MEAFFVCVLNCTIWCECCQSEIIFIPDMCLKTSIAICTPDYFITIHVLRTFIHVKIHVRWQEVFQLDL